MTIQEAWKHYIDQDPVSFDRQVAWRLYCDVRDGKFSGWHEEQYQKKQREKKARTLVNTRFN